MEPIEFSLTDQGFHIEGFPDAVKVLALDDVKSKRLADLVLNKHDLEFSIECLNLINKKAEPTDVTQRSLWVSAIAYFFKCFQWSAARSKLDANIIFADDPQGLEIFKHYKDLRDKHYLHDENALSQCLPGAVLNKRGVEYKIAKIVSTLMTGIISVEEEHNNMLLLSMHSRDWVIKEHDKLADEITAELEAKDYDTLYAMNSPVYKKPAVEDFGKNRNGR